jgi:predicted RNA-binding Zn-ribbon protein involved in translation (DUF1610 family)
MRQRRSVFDRGLGNGSAPMTRPVSFFSTCPACGQQQLQRAYTRRALLRLLRSGNIIDAYCLACDVVWPVTAQERDLVVAAIASGQPGATSTPGGNDLPRRSL